jgi:hypothetical protein
MFRLAARSLPILGFLVVLGICPAGRAQPPDADPLRTKAKARALREVQRADPKELTRALLDTRRAVYAKTATGVEHGGIRDLERAPDVLRDLLTAEVVAAPDPAGRIATLERHCARLGHLEEIIRYPAEAGVGAFLPQDYWEFHGERLLTEMWLVQALAGARAPLPGSLTDTLDNSGPLDSRDAERREFAALRTTPRALGQAAVDAAGQAFRIRERYKIPTGDSIPQDGFADSRWRVEVERALGKQSADLLPALESHWQAAWSRKQLAWERAVVPWRSPAYLEAYSDLLEAEAWIAEARSRPGRSPWPLKGSFQDRFGAVDDPFDVEEHFNSSYDLLTLNKLARAKYQGTVLPPGESARERRDKLAAAYAGAVRQLRRGYAPVSFCEELSRQLMTVELALAAGDAERLGARERYWARARDVEEITRRLAAFGVRWFPERYPEAVCEYLQAELWLVEARGKKGEK